MAKPNVSIRVDPDFHKAITQAAKEERKSIIEMSGLIASSPHWIDLRKRK